MKNFIISKFEKIHNNIIFRKIRKLELQLLKNHLNCIRLDVNFIREIGYPTSDYEKEHLEIAIQNFEKHVEEMRERYITRANDILTDYVLNKQKNTSDET